MSTIYELADIVRKRKEFLSEGQDDLISVKFSEILAIEAELKAATAAREPYGDRYTVEELLSYAEGLDEDGLTTGGNMLRQAADDAKRIASLEAEIASLKGDAP